MSEEFKPIEVRPDVTIEPDLDKVELIMLDTAAIALAFTPDGPRIVLALDGKNYAIKPEKWNEMLVGLSMVAHHLGMESQAVSFAPPPDGAPSRPGKPFGS